GVTSPTSMPPKAPPIAPSCNSAGSIPNLLRRRPRVGAFVALAGASGVETSGMASHREGENVRLQAWQRTGRSSCSSGRRTFCPHDGHRNRSDMIANPHPYDLPLSRSTATMRPSRTNNLHSVNTSDLQIPYLLNGAVFSQDTFPRESELCHIRLF